jgi:hypothetical protein
MLDPVKVMAWFPFAMQVLLFLIGLLTAATAFVNTVMRLLPARWVSFVETKYPRAAHLARATRAGGADTLKFLKSLYAFFVGSPFFSARLREDGDGTVEFNSSVPGTLSVEPRVPPRGNPGFFTFNPLAFIAVFAVPALLVGIAIGAALFLHGCSAQQQRRTNAAVIVSAGGVVEGLRQANRDAYVHATDALRAHVQGEEYARQSEPLDEAFRARGRAIRDLTGVLYATAHLNDRADVTLAERAAAARDILAQLRDLTAILRNGSALPPVPIPLKVDEAEAALEGLATLVAGGVQ